MKSFFNERNRTYAVNSAKRLGLCLGLLAVHAGAAMAESLVWTGQAGSDWATPGNWTPSQVPQAGDTVLISSPSATISLNQATPQLATFNLQAGTLLVSGWDSALRADTLTIAGRITHKENETPAANAAGDWVPQHRIVIEGVDLTLTSSGVLDADNKGYRRGTGPGSVGGWNSGAGHAGEGGFGNGRPGGPGYGDIHAPWQPGSGGGTNVTYRTQSGEGGGAIRIHVTGELTLDGTIRANGRSYYGTHGSGGSGGSIWIDCRTLIGSGSGRVQVNGGNGSYYGGGGSGGRMAIQFDPAAQAALTEPRPPIRFEGIPGAITAQNRETFPASMGTLSVSAPLLFGNRLEDRRLMDVQLAVPGWTSWSLDTLTVDDCSVGLQEGVSLMVAGDLVVTNGARLHVFAAPVSNVESVPGARVELGGSLRIHARSWVLPYAHPTNGATVAFTMGGDLQVDEGGGFDADRRGYTRGYGPGTGRTTRTDGGNGAGYGGHSGMGFGGVRWGDAYGDAEWPVEAGSGGTVLLPNAWNAGRGGGAIRLDVAGQAELYGTLTAQGGHGWSPTHGGGGSGGGILLQCQTLRGGNSAQLLVTGGQATGGGSGGGGGRIAIHYDPVAQAALVNPAPPVRFSAGTYPVSTTGYSSIINAQEGTLWLPDTQFLTEQIDRQRFWKVRLVIPGLTAWSPAKLTIDDCIVTLPDGFTLSVANDLTLTNNASLTMGAAPTNAPLQRYGAELTVGRDLLVAANSWICPQAHPTNGAIVGIRVERNAVLMSEGGIDAAGRGYYAVPGNTLGPGAGQATYNSGGGYGGQGGGGSQAGGTYGCAELPNEPGSPGGWNGYGGSTGYSVGGNGGGAVHLRAGGTVRIDGLVDANGGQGAYYRGSGGSGGSIFIAAPRIVGGGTLQAKGAQGMENFASGGGGRIAIWQDVSLADIEARLTTGSTLGLRPITSASFSGTTDAGWSGTSSAGLPTTGSVVFLCTGNLFFEAEHFTPSSSGWSVGDNGRASSTQALLGASGDKQATASQRIQIVEGGAYRVWVRYVYYNDTTRGPFSLAIMSNGLTVTNKIFDLVSPPDGVANDFVWDYVDVDLSEGEYELVLAKHEPFASSGYVRKVDCVLLRPMSEEASPPKSPIPPDHRDYGPQTYMRATIGFGYTTNVYVHIFADHYRSDWYSHHYLSKNGTGNGTAPATSLRLTNGEQTPWCNITRLLYQDSGAILNITLRHTYTVRPDQMRARFEFANVPDDDAVIRTMDVTAQPNGLIVVMPPNLATELNRSRLGRDLDFAERTGQLADAYAWSTVGRKPTKFPFFVSASIGGYGTPPDQVVIDRERRTLDYFGFANWTRTTFGGGMWNNFESSYCRPDTNKIMVAAAKRAQELTDAGKTYKDVVYCMLMDEPTGQSLDFMATDTAYQAAFVAWLKGKNLTPTELGTNDWANVRTVLATERVAFPALYYYSQRFRTRALGDFMAFQRRALEAACGGPIPVNANFSDGATYYANFYGQGVDYFELLDDEGPNAIWSEDWANGSSSYQCGAYNVDLMRAAARERGQQLGHYVIAHAGRLPFDVKLKVAANVARGVRMMKSFSYGVYWGSHEGGPSWSTHVWQNRPQMWGPHAEALSEIGGAEDMIMDAVIPPAKVAILYASSSDIWQLSGIGGNYAYGFDRMHTWMALAHAQIPVDFLSEAQVERGALADYRVCYLQGPNLRQAAATKVAEWVNAGGTLMVTAGAGARDEYNRPLTTIESLLPATRGTLSTLQNFVNSGSYLNILNSKATVTVGGTTINVLSVRQPLTAKSGTTTRGKFNDNTPAWVYGTQGSGNVHCLGFLPALDYIRTALVTRKALVTQAAAEDQVAIDGVDVGSGNPLDSVSEEDRWRLEHSANPWAYPPAMREAILAPVREAAIDPPVICSVPLIDAGYMTSAKGILIPLANYTLYPLPMVDFSVRSGRPVAYVETIHQGRIPFQQQGRRVSFSLPLASTDYIKIVYKIGFEIRLIGGRP